MHGLSFCELKSIFFQKNGNPLTTTLEQASQCCIAILNNANRRPFAPKASNRVVTPFLGFTFIPSSSELQLRTEAHRVQFVRQSSVESPIF